MLDVLPQIEPIKDARTHDLWDELGHQIHLYLSSVTLADVCAGRVLGTSRLFDAAGATEMAAQ